MGSQGPIPPFTPHLREAAFLRDQAGTTVTSLMLKFDAFIAGGAVTSAFSSTRINDFDLFFQNKTSLDAAIAEVPMDDKTVVTDSALSVILDGHRVQFIKVVTGTPEEVIDTFDFTVCQAAYSWRQGFMFGREFMKHLAQRRLVFNIAAKYPICSLYRARKFIRRGFHFSGIEAIKLGLRIQALEIETYKQLREQLMGIDTLFLKDLTDSLKGQDEKKYDMNEFFETLEAWLYKLDAMTGNEETPE